MNLSEKYTRTAIFLHWLIALLILVNLVLVWTVDSLPEAFTRAMIDTHKSVGITVLGLALMRILWRITHRPPQLPAFYPRWEKFAAHAAHGVLYLLILALPISGWMHDSAWKDAPTHPMSLYYLIPWPRLGFITGLDPETKEAMHTLFGEIHELFGTILYIAVGLHILGALKHQFIDKEKELQRILP